LECKTPLDGKGNWFWGEGPLCVQVQFASSFANMKTQKSMEFRFGIDSFVYCSWMVYNQSTYTHLKNLILLQGKNLFVPFTLVEDWICRIATSPGHEVFIPVPIPIWGIVEPDHLHLNNHLNMIFHAQEGRIVGASIYQGINM
jgi:hypothetical protein